VQLTPAAQTVKHHRALRASHPLIEEARALGFWHKSFSDLERLVISHGHRALAELPTGALAARTVAERECRSHLTRHIHKSEGAV
jgi:hypothetical protein